MNEASHHDRMIHRPSRLLEARANVRAYEKIDIEIMRCIALLPDDDYCRSAQEALQYGVGYAYLQVKEDTAFDPLVDTASDAPTLHPELVNIFFNSRPVNRYIPPTELQIYRDHVAWLATQSVLGKQVGELEDWVNVYELEALVAFITGYQLVYCSRSRI